MAIGPGKYDDLCTWVRKKAKARGVVIIVVGGNKGQGFSAQCDAFSLLTLPDALEGIAAEMRKAGPRG